MSAAMVGAVLYGADDAVTAWVHQRLPMTHGPFRDFRALGIVHDGRIVGGVVFTQWRGLAGVEVSGAIEPGFRCSPATLRRVLAYAFGQLDCVRIGFTTGRKNKAARAFLERLGARVEGVRRRGLDGRQDAILYGLLRDECRFWKGYGHG